MSKIFISSTFRDLIEHRRAVNQAILDSGHQPIAMENFGSQPQDATTASRDEVLHADKFVGIYAHRYGYRPDGGKSVTELEYEAARDADIPCFVFIVEDGYRVGLLGEHAETDTESIAMLEDFKARLNTALVRTTFTTPDMLATKVIASLHRAMEQPGDNTAAKPSASSSFNIEINGTNFGPIGNIGDNFTQNIDTDT